MKLENASTRDEDAIRKIFNGFMKLLYPNAKPSKAELKDIVDFAVSYRNTVLKQIYNIYHNKKYDRVISYKIDDE